MRVPSRLSVTLRQHETRTYTRYDSWRLASGALAPDVPLINDRDLAEHTPLAHFTLNFDKRHPSTAHPTQNAVCWLRLQSPINRCLIWNVSPCCAATTLPHPRTKETYGSERSGVGPVCFPAQRPERPTPPRRRGASGGKRATCPWHVHTAPCAACRSPSRWSPNVDGAPIVPRELC